METKFKFLEEDKSYGSGQTAALYEIAYQLKRIADMQRK